MLSPPSPPLSETAPLSSVLTPLMSWRENTVPPSVTETPTGPRQSLAPGLIQSAVGFDLGIGGSATPFGTQSVETLTPMGLQSVPGTYETVEPPREPEERGKERVGVREVPLVEEVEEEEESYRTWGRGCVDAGTPFSPDRLLLPPPIIRAASQTNSRTPGQVEHDDGGELIQRFIRYQGISKFLIEIYDNWVQNILPRQISSVVLDLLNGDLIAFEGLALGPPTYTDDQSRPMYPQYARNNALTYGLNLYTDAVHYTWDFQRVPDPAKRTGPDGRAELQRARIYIGTIPLMVGSHYCYLSKMSDHELIAIGEDPDDPFGYFIVKGNQKVTKIQEQLGTSKVMIFPQTAKTPPVCRMTVPTPTRGTPLLFMTLAKDRKTIRWQLSIDRKNNQWKSETINILVMYYLYGMQDMRQIEEFLALFIRPERRVNCFNRLLMNKIKMHKFAGDPVGYVAGKLKMSPEASREQKEEAVVKLVYEDFFPHLDAKYEPLGEGNTGNYLRLGLLSYMLARFLEHLAGYRKADDRDDWAYKKLQTAGPLMEQMFRSLWRRALRAAQKGILEGSYTGLRYIQSAIDPSIITDEFYDSFNTSHWGVKNIFTKENVSETLNMDSFPLSAISHLLRIDVNVNRSGRNKNMRQIGLSSQLGFVCPAETPEGDPIGIVKNLAITASVTIDRSDHLVLQYLLSKATPRVFPRPSAEHQSVTLSNGKFLGWCDGPRTRDFLRFLRTRGHIWRETCVVLDFEGVLHIYTDGARVIRPLLVVNRETQVPILEEKGLWDAAKAGNFVQLLQEGAIEYLDPFEQQYINLASSLTTLRVERDKKAAANLAYEQAVADVKTIEEGGQVRIPATLTDPEWGAMETFVNLDLAEATRRMTDAANVLERVKRVGLFTHCELHPISMFGHGAAVAPATNHQQGPRTSYQAKMGGQAMTVYHTNHLNRFEGKTKLAAFPNRDLFGTVVGDVISRPAGETVTVAVLADSYTQEDAFVISKAAVDNGRFLSVKYNVYTTKVIHTIDISEELRKPSRIQPNEDPDRYKYITEDGLPMIGAMLKTGDCVIGKIQTRLRETNPENREVNASVFMKVGDRGIIDNVYVYTQHGTTVVQVKTRQVHKPEAGDKFTFRYSQKGTAGIIRATADMPFSMETGIAPDVIVNPHAIPSRMTIGLLIEILTGKEAAVGDGTRRDATPFQTDKRDIGAILREHGFQPGGYETFISGTRGTPFRAQVFTGVAYLSALKHQVEEKIQARGFGLVKQINRQPQRGKSFGGGLRFGEMERDMVISFGASQFLIERLMRMSDLYQAVMCTVCGTFAVQDPASSKYMCRLCGTRGKFGRAEIPYATKRLMQLLAGAAYNIRFKLRTPEEEMEERRIRQELEEAFEEEEVANLLGEEEEEELESEIIAGEV